MSNKVLVLGAGMVVQPLIDYLLENDIEVTLASRTFEKAEKAIAGRQNGVAVAWTIDDLGKLEEMIVQHDLVVSLLPYTHHVTVAKLCINHSTNMLTTSYISEEMNSLDEAARDAGVIILNEIGVDPGFDHMTAMRIIDMVHERGGQIEEFYSLCGALAAPEALDNPLKYKFSWSPKGVVMAGNNDARYLEKGEEKYKETKDLFKGPLHVDFPEVGLMHVYPNRNSLPYIDIYGIAEAKTIYRGTFRYPGWCEAMDAIKAMNLTGYDEYTLAGKTYADFTAEVAGVAEDGDVKNAVIVKYQLSEDAPAIQALEWLGMLDDKKIPLERGSAFDVLSDLMIDKMMLKADERDMVMMQHIFTVLHSDGTREKIRSSLLDYGDSRYTSIAKTVALPAAIGVKMILDGKIDILGVHIPIKKEIYTPILRELEKLGISMKEEFGLPA